MMLGICVVRVSEVYSLCFNQGFYQVLSAEKPLDSIFDDYNILLIAQRSVPTQAESH